MKIEEVEKFLGLPAQSAEFDEYLTSHGISYRPIYKKKPVDRISVKQDGISLVFDTAILYRRTHGPLREEGEMILSSLQAYGEVNDSGYSQYPESLPYGLSFNSTLKEAVKIFGEPTLDHPSGNDRVYVWYDYRGDTIGICFLRDDGGISFFDLSRKSNEPPVPFDWD